MYGWGGGKQGGLSLKGGQTLKQTYREKINSWWPKGEGG